MVYRERLGYPITAGYCAWYCVFETFKQRLPHIVIGGVAGIVSLAVKLYIPPLGMIILWVVG